MLDRAVRDTLTQTMQLALQEVSDPASRDELHAMFEHSFNQAYQEIYDLLAQYPEVQIADIENLCVKAVRNIAKMMRGTARQPIRNSGGGIFGGGMIKPSASKPVTGEESPKEDNKVNAEKEKEEKAEEPKSNTDPFEITVAGLSKNSMKRTDFILKSQSFQVEYRNSDEDTCLVVDEIIDDSIISIRDLSLTSDNAEAGVVVLVDTNTPCYFDTVTEYVDKTIDWAKKLPMRAIVRNNFRLCSIMAPGVVSRLRQAKAAVNSGDPMKALAGIASLHDLPDVGDFAFMEFVDGIHRYLVLTENPAIRMGVDDLNDIKGLLTHESLSMFQREARYEEVLTHLCKRILERIDICDMDSVTDMLDIGGLFVSSDLPAYKKREISIHMAKGNYDFIDLLNDSVPIFFNYTIGVANFTPPAVSNAIANSMPIFTVQSGDMLDLVLRENRDSKYANFNTTIIVRNESYWVLKDGATLDMPNNIYILD